MDIREITGDADVRRLVKYAREVWSESNISFITPEQV